MAVLHRESEGAMAHYTGVGSRRTPGDILNIMENLAFVLAGCGWTLRSGGAAGADRAFERGAFHGKRQIFSAGDATAESMLIASRFHPAWDRLSGYAQRLHGRNVFQVMGIRIDEPSKFLVCWTPDGATTHAERSIQTGGTGTAISVAEYFDVPIFNLERPDHRARIEKYISAVRP